LARIGTLRTVFPTAFGCPRQGLAAPSVRGCIELAPWMLNKGGNGDFLEGLEGFSHVWIIFLFDQNRHSSASFDPSKSFLRPTVKPPWLTGADGKRGSHGVFATRSPHRPNPVGLTLCCLDLVDHSTGKVYLSGVDVIDGSAVLDLKPYHPVDSLRFARPAGLVALDGDPDAGSNRPLPDAAIAGVLMGAGSEPSSIADGAEGGTHWTTVPAARFPAWMPAPRAHATVRWSDEAFQQLKVLQPYCVFYPDRRDEANAMVSAEAPLRTLRRALEEVLGLDPRTPQSRCKGADTSETTHRFWALDFDTLSVVFRLCGCHAADESQQVDFEVVRVELRECRGARSSKAWLEALRLELESPCVGDHDTRDEPAAMASEGVASGVSGAVH